VLLAGFPCQPFSIAGVSKKNALGRPHGFECKEQGNLFFHIASILEELRPPAFLLENVKNLERHDKGNTFRVIMDVLEKDLNYKVQYKVIDAAKHKSAGNGFPTIFVSEMLQEGDLLLVAKKTDGSILIITRALQAGVREALKRHKQAGNPIVGMKDGQMVWLKPEDIQV